MSVAVDEAPGKILLMGEHAVVYGHPAIAIPLREVSARVEVEFTRDGVIEMDAPDLGEHATGLDEASPRLRPLMGLASSVARFFEEHAQGLRITIHSTIPIGRGMGSGAAVAVALVRGVCQALGRSLDAEQVSELATQAEQAFHGSPSGVDSAVVARNEPIYYVKGKMIRSIDVGPTVFRFVIADTGIESPTAEVVEAVRCAREEDRAHYDSFFWELGSMASVSREVIRSGSAEELGICMSQSHRILQNLNVSCSELDRLVAVAMEKGALGAKLSGAGRGGAMIALINEDTDANRFANDLRAAGAETVLTTMLGSVGERT